MKILQVILALSVLIVIHEFGHFSFAKLFGIRVEKFFLFFDIGSSKTRAWTRRLSRRIRNHGNSVPNRPGRGFS